jgi:hypothetical protein
MAFTKTKPAKGGSKKQGEYDNTNRGVLFVNDKDGNESRPDYTGNLKLKPDDYTVGSDGLIFVRLAAWKQPSEKVGEFLSIAASAPKAE